MRIAHVVTLLSADGAFGGPLTVALEHVAELRRRGHDVDFYAGWDTVAVPGVAGARLHPVRRLVPGRRNAGLVSPGLFADVVRARKRYDVIHVHMGRDLVTLPAAAALTSLGAPVVLQTHGMVGADPRLPVRVLDRLATRRALRTARATLWLTPDECASLRAVSHGAARLRPLRNGVQAGQADTVLDPEHEPRVLFLARLHPRKRVTAFLEMAELLHQAGVRATFVVAGPDEGELPAVSGALAGKPATLDLRYIGALDGAAARRELARAAVYVLPSRDEPFPMTVLEALAAGTPTVLTESCGIAADLHRAGAAAVTDGSPAALAAAVTSLLDPAQRRRQRAAGLAAIRDRYSIAAVVDELEDIYRAIR